MAGGCASSVAAPLVLGRRRVSVRRDSSDADAVFIDTVASDIQPQIQTGLDGPLNLGGGRITPLTPRHKQLPDTQNTFKAIYGRDSTDSQWMRAIVPHVLPRCEDGENVHYLFGVLDLFYNPQPGSKGQSFASSTDNSKSGGTNRKFAPACRAWTAPATAVTQLSRRWLYN